MTCLSLTSWVNSELGLEDDEGYKEETVRNWLHLCGFNMKETKKGCYYDGHERDDVVKVSPQLKKIKVIK